MAIDEFQSFMTDLKAPPINSVAITPADTDLPLVTRSLYVGTGGDVAALLCNDTVPVIFKNVPSGAFLPIRCSQVRLTGTTAGDIVGLS